jgi:hypothetical protein
MLNYLSSVFIYSLFSESRLFAILFYKLVLFDFLSVYFSGVTVRGNPMPGTGVSFVNNNSEKFDHIPRFTTPDSSGLYFG